MNNLRKNNASSRDRDEQINEFARRQLANQQGEQKTATVLLHSVTSLLFIGGYNL